MQVALGRTPEEEVADNSHLLSKYLRGSVALLFTNMTEKQLEEFLNSHTEPDFAKAGHKATYTVFLPKGTEALEAFGHGMEPQFRALGLPTKLNMQKIELLADTYVCRQGEELSVE
jgi:mRNA turnover protein 4